MICRDRRVEHPAVPSAAAPIAPHCIKSLRFIEHLFYVYSECAICSQAAGLQYNLFIYTIPVPIVSGYNPDLSMCDRYGRRYPEYSHTPV